MPQESPRLANVLRGYRGSLPTAFRATLILGGLALASCGGGSEPAPSAADCASSGPQEITVIGNDRLKFDEPCYTAGAGEVTFDYLLSPESNQIHDLRIEGQGLFLEIDALTRETSGTASLDTGAYNLFCSISGHRAAGMEAKLVIT